MFHNFTCLFQVGKNPDLLHKYFDSTKSTKKGLNIDLINPEVFKFLTDIHFFKDFQYKTFRAFLCL